MERMPYQPDSQPESMVAPSTGTAPSVSDWRKGLPTLGGNLTTLRELRSSDAPALLAAMSGDEVARFISPPPSTVEGFEKFIAWTHRERAAGRYICFAVVPHGSDVVIGLFQIRSLEADFGSSEWGFALAVEYWGTGIFTEGAELVVDFAFDMLGCYRLEARASVRNGRGNGALRKLGAVQEGVLRRSFLRNGEYMDQALWTILKEEWIEAKVIWNPNVVH